MDVRDCERLATRGLLALDTPPYCSVNATTPYSSTSYVRYSILVQKHQEHAWTVYISSEWTKTKTIVGSFWVGAYDTTFSHVTRSVSTLDCWNMVKNHKCNGYAMTPLRQGKPNDYEFTKDPDGEGKWYATREYSVPNCLVQQITLRMEDLDGPIISPFGMHNVTASQHHFVYNHHTVV